MRLALLVLAACSAPAADPIARPIANTPSTEAPPLRGRYLGTVLDLGPQARSTTMHLPGQLTEVSLTSTADVHIVVARHGRDLVILTTAMDGIVVDDITLPALADTHAIVSDCADNAFLGAVATADCPDGKGIATARAAWNLEGPKLRPVAAPVRCVCDQLFIGE